MKKKSTEKAKKILHKDYDLEDLFLRHKLKQSDDRLQRARENLRRCFEMKKELLEKIEINNEEKEIHERRVNHLKIKV